MNHLHSSHTQAHDINALFGFRLECLERLGEEFVFVWRRINELFNYLPLAASIEDKILCMHGGIGRSINKVCVHLCACVRRRARAHVHVCFIVAWKC